MVTLKSILVATDFSEAAETALVYGRALASQFGATLHVLNVTDTLFRFIGIEGYITDTTGLKHDLEQFARRRLDAAVTEEDRRTLHAKAVLRMSSAPALAIVEYARGSGIDLIVIGTHGHGRLAHLLASGVVDHVVRTAPCPVLVVRHPEHEFLTADSLEHLTPLEEFRAGVA